MGELRTADRRIPRVISGRIRSAGSRRTRRMLVSGSAALSMLAPALMTLATPPANAEPVAPATHNLRVLDGGTWHSLAVQNDGQAWSWGDNSVGQLGDGGTASTDTPRALADLTDAAAISSGGDHSLAVTTGGSVLAWGSNSVGQLGDGTTQSSNIPVSVTGLSGVRDVAGGNYHSLAVTETGQVWSWGWNGTGQLGDGSTVSSTSPVRVSGLTDVVDIEAGGLPGWSGFSVALKADGTVWTWGYNKQGQLGDGTQTHKLTPVQVGGVSNAVAIAAGGSSAYALTANGDVWAWGNNEFGQLGNVDVRRLSTTPVQVAVSGITDIAAGGTHALAAAEDGTAWSWGNNNTGQLGNPSTGKTSDVPVPIPTLSNVSIVAAGYLHSFAALEDGTVWAWGRNVEGQLGTASGPLATTPVRIGTLDRVMPPAEALTVTIASPMTGDQVDARGGLKISGTAVGGTTPLETVTVLVDGIEVVTEPVWDTSGTTWSVTVVPPAVGDYEISVVVTDAAGLKGTDAITVSVTEVLSILPGETVVAPSTVVLEQATIDGLAPVTYPVETLRFMTAEVPFGPGDVVVADISEAAPEGLLVRVRDVVRDGDTWVATVEEAAFTDAFLQADLSYDSTASSGMSIQSEGSAGCVEQTFDQKLEITDNLGKVSGSIAVVNSGIGACVDFTFDLVVHYAWDWHSEGVLHTYETSVEVDASAGMDMSFTGNVEVFSKKWPEKPKTAKLPTIKVMAGYVPIIITNEVGLQGEARGDFSGSLTTGAAGNWIFTGGLRYTKADGWEDWSTFNDYLTYDRPTYDGAKFDASVGPNLFLNSKFYGQVGAQFRVRPMLRGVVSQPDAETTWFKASLETDFSINAEFPKRLGRYTPKWSHSFANPEVVLWEGPLSGGGGSHVVIAGMGDEATAISELEILLERAGYQVTVSPTIPESLSGVGQVWWVDYRPIPTADLDRLVQFVKGGGGLYLTGERPCCEDLNAGVSRVVNDLVEGGGVGIGGLGDPFYQQGPVPVNQAVVGGLANNPLAVTEVVMNAPGGMSGVYGDNVLAYAPGSQVPVAGAWDETDLVGTQGRLVVVMDVNWLDPSRQGPQADAFAQNLALFLSGETNPPGTPVTADVQTKALVEPELTDSGDDSPSSRVAVGSEG